MRYIEIQKARFSDRLNVEIAIEPVVVFVTAYDEHALRAFEVNAIDYLLKTCDDARLVAALSRAKDAIRRRHADQVGSRLSQLLRLLEKDRPNQRQAGTPATTSTPA